MKTPNGALPLSPRRHSAYNGHFESTCYHPLLLFNREGDCLGPSCGRAMYTAPRVGTAGSADLVRQDKPG